jgi:hypothetical protein
MTFRRSFSTTLGIVALAALVQPTSAESVRVRPKAVVELFTSQGCAQCPPADALLTGLAEEGDVVALAYHVDYWDYVGWEDTFGDEDFSDRQRGKPPPAAAGWRRRSHHAPRCGASRRHPWRH